MPPPPRAVPAARSDRGKKASKSGGGKSGGGGGDRSSSEGAAMKAEWLAWSKLLVPRLELTDENELRVGEPPRQANGLPRGFTLGESESSLHQEELEEGNLQTRRKSMVGRKLPKADPRHVELFFRSL